MQTDLPPGPYNMADHIKLEVSMMGKDAVWNLAKSCGRITLQAHGILEQGRAQCRRESYAF